MSEPPKSLSQAAEEFADELSETFQAVLGPHIPNFVADILDHEDVAGSREPSRVSVTPPNEEAVPLHIDGSTALSIYCYFFCEWDHERAFLKVTKSGIHVASEDDSTALFRYEFVEKNSKRLPGAHLHVHAHRDETLYAMLRGQSKRVKQRHDAATGKSGRRRPRLSELHFPLGGSRMRPCVEDVLQMLIQEFDIDVASNAQAALTRGRVTWRERQIAALVRDAPEIAVRSLQRMGYAIELPATGHPARRADKLEYP